MYKSVAALLPGNVKKSYIQLLRYSGIHVPPERFLGFLAITGILVGLGTMFYGALIFQFPLIASFFGGALVFELLVYSLLLLQSDAKARFVEGILPDVLQLMASNLRAGLTTERALLLSARPEFGPFQEEINLIGKEITMGKNIDEVLLSLGKRFKSEKLSKTLALIVSGLQSGGELAALLEQTARNVRQQELVDSRIKASIMMYSIFVMIALCIGAPLLFGLSSFLVEVLVKNMGGIDIPQGAMASLPFSLGKVSIPIEFVTKFSVIFLLSSSILGSMLMGLLMKGKEREGLKYMPAIAGISLLIFFLSRNGIKNMLGGILGVS